MWVEEEKDEAEERGTTRDEKRERARLWWAEYDSLIKQYSVSYILNLISCVIKDVLQYY